MIENDPADAETAADRCTMCRAGVPHDHSPGVRCLHVSEFDTDDAPCCADDRAAQVALLSSLWDLFHGGPVRVPVDPAVDPVGAVWFG